MVLLHVVSKRKGWTPFNIARTVIILVIGVALPLVCLITTNLTAASNYIESSWMLPTLCIAFFVVLVITHLPHPTGSSACVGKKRSRRQRAEEANGTLMPGVGPPPNASQPAASKQSEPPPPPASAHSQVALTAQADPPV